MEQRSPKATEATRLGDQNEGDNNEALPCKSDKPSRASSPQNQGMDSVSIAIPSSHLPGLGNIESASKNVKCMEERGRNEEDRGTRRSISKQNSGPKKDSKLLPLNFQPTPYSVIIGRGKEAKDHAVGNRRLKILVSQFITQYASAINRPSKSKIVSSVVSMVRDACSKEGDDSSGAFVKLGKDGRWYEVSDSVAREKVGYTFRELLGERYRSSSQSKVARKHQLREDEPSSFTSSKNHQMPQQAAGMDNKLSSEKDKPSIITQMRIDEQVLDPPTKLLNILNKSSFPSIAKSRSLPSNEIAHQFLKKNPSLTSSNQQDDNKDLLSDKTKHIDPAQEDTKIPSLAHLQDFSTKQPPSASNPSRKTTTTASAGGQLGDEDLSEMMDDEVATEDHQTFQDS